MAVVTGLRERKKQRTRQEIFDAARRLFQRKGFDAVTVAEVARAADVSEVTVFNYFPTKEDLFYGGMQFFEEQLIEAVRNRPPGESAVKAFRHALLGGAGRLELAQSADAILAAGRLVSASPALQARERDIVDRFTRRLADLLAGAGGDAVEAQAVAGALMATHRALVEHVRRRVLTGRRGKRLADEYRDQARRALGRLENGLAGYAVNV
ncbi:MAG TPA: helix-turn-helix domain-containing protein [Candidatus Dormibacteraeota bacterium]|nr:helix-turn-helix domain-containing protein [Candidatus Dormibacteraeota bacterium]